MDYTFIINLIYSNLNSISNILNAVNRQYRFLASKTFNFEKLSFVIFLRFSEDFGN